MRWTTLLGTVAVSALTLCALARQDVMPLPVVAPEIAPPYLDFGSQLPSLDVDSWMQPPPDGKSFDSAITGKAVVIEFWATWCAPCVAAIPHMNALAEEFKNEPIVFASIACDDVEKVRAFLGTHTMRSWVGVDTDQSVFRTIPTPGLPTTVLVDKQGKIQSITHPDFVTDEVLRDLLAGKRIRLESMYGGAMSSEQMSALCAVDGPAIAEVVPVMTQRGWANQAGTMAVFFSHTPKHAIARAWGVRESEVRDEASLGELRYTARVRMPGAKPEAVRDRMKSLLAETFGVEIEIRQEPRKVWVLRSGDDMGASRRASGTDEEMRVFSDDTHITGTAMPVSRVGEFLQQEILLAPVVDETGRTTPDTWTLELSVDAKPEAVIHEVRTQLGLILEQAERPQAVLIIRKRARDAAAPEASTSERVEGHR